MILVVNLTASRSTLQACLLGYLWGISLISLTEVWQTDPPYIWGTYSNSSPNKGSPREECLLFCLLAFILCWQIYLNCGALLPQILSSLNDIRTQLLWLFNVSWRPVALQKPAGLQCQAGTIETTYLWDGQLSSLPLQGESSHCWITYTWI